MTTARLDESIVPILENAKDRIVIQAKDGRVLGYFQPTTEEPYTRQSPYSEDEIRAVMRNPGKCISLAEFWKRMEGK
jgi:hypothetical protein